MWNQLSTPGNVFLIQWLLKVHLHSFTVFVCEYQVRVPSGSQVRVVRQVFTSALPFALLSVKIPPKLRALERHMPIYGHIYMPAEIQHLHFIKLWCWEFGFPNPVRSMFPEGSRLLPLLLQSLCTAALLKSNASSKIGLIIPRLNIFSQPLYATRETHLHLTLFCVGFLQTRPLPSYKCRHLGWRDGIWGISRSKNSSDHSIRSRVQVSLSNTE